MDLNDDFGSEAFALKYLYFLAFKNESIRVATITDEMRRREERIVKFGGMELTTDVHNCLCLKMNLMS